MKKFLYLLFLPAMAVTSISSCVDAGMYGGVGGGPAYGAAGGSFTTYSTLPPNYSGNAYYYQGRYYSGGRYETGRYNYQGRSYTNRYYHNGRYYYGGTHQNHTASRSQHQGGPSYRNTSSSNAWHSSYRGGSPGPSHDARRSDGHDHDRDRYGDRDHDRSSSRHDRGTSWNANMNSSSPRPSPWAR